MDIKTIEGNFNVAIDGGHPTVARHFKFSDGSVIDFSITLPPDYSATLVDLHQRSVTHAIALLQDMLKPT